MKTTMVARFMQITRNCRVLQVMTLVVVSAIAAGLAGSSPAMAADLPVVQVGITGQAVYYAAIFVAQEKGYFEEEGIKFEWVSLNVPDMVRAIASGSLGVGLPVAADAMLVAHRGAPVAVAAGFLDRFPYDLVVQPDIKSFEDLRGKIIGHWQISPSVPLALLKRLLAQNGLSDSEYGVVAAGNNFERYAALSRGAIAGAVLADPVNFRAAGEGFNLLGGFYDVPVAFDYTIVNTNWARQHEKELVALLKALIRGDRYARDPANREEVIALAAERTNIEKEYVAQAYDLLFVQRPEILSRDWAIDETVLDNSLAILVELGLVPDPAPPASTFIVDHYWKRAIQELDGK